MSQQLDLPYTLCFCIAGDQVLMMYRHRNPNQFKWNGLGGKIEAGETPWQAVHREVWEESGIDLNKADHSYFAGLVTWSTIQQTDCNNKGMYVYIAYFPELLVEQSLKQLEEGRLAWKSISWVSDKNSQELIINIPGFFPSMLKKIKPVQYIAVYQDGQFAQVAIKKLPTKYLKQQNLI